MKSLISCKARSIRFSLHHCFSKSGPEIISWHPGLPKNVAPRFAANSVSHAIPASSYTANEREGNSVLPTSMKDARNELFSKGVINTEEFDQFVGKWIPRSNVAGYAAFMMYSGKKSNNNGSNMARNLPALAVHLQTLTESKWTGPHIAFVMFGLQNFDEKVEGYLSIVSSMNRVIKRAIRCNVPFEFQDSAMALLGLQKNQLNNSESLEMLVNIASMIKVSNDVPLARTSANALYGLKAMNSASCQVQLLLSRLAESVQSCIEPFNSQNVGNALYGLQRMSCDDREVLSLLTALVPKVQDCTESLNSQEIGNALYGLQGMRSNSREVRQLIAALVPKVQKCEGRFTAQTVGNALYGLQGMSSDDHEVGLLLTALVPKVQDCTESLNSQEIGNALYGLQSMKSDSLEALSMITALVPKVQKCTNSPNSVEVISALFGLRGMTSERSETRQLISALIPKIEGSVDRFTSKMVGTALYCLRSLSSNRGEVRQLIAALVPKVQKCEGRFTAQTVGNALYGLQGMSSDDHEVGLLLTALVPKVQDCTEFLNSQEIGNALYGLQGMRSNSREVRQLIAALVPKVQKCEGRFTAQTVGNALYGLQGMSSDDHEVGLLLTALVPKVQDCTESLNSQEIGNALYGLQGMRRSESLLRILCVIQREASSNIDFASLSAIELKSFGVFVALSMPWLRAVLDTSELLGWQRVEELLQESSRKCLTSSSVGARVVRHNSAERRVLTAADRLFGSSNIRVFNNIFLHQFFECDILIKVPISVRPAGGAGTGEGEEGEWLTVNIEVDGLQHARATNSRRDGLRDTYLGERGVVVKRVKSGSLSLMNDAQLNEWILEAASDAVLSRATAYES
jgi:conjugal transfer/entry exclusion protein